MGGRSTTWDSKKQNNERVQEDSWYERERVRQRWGTGGGYLLEAVFNHVLPMATPGTNEVSE